MDPAVRNSFRKMSLVVKEGDEDRRLLKKTWWEGTLRTSSRRSEFGQTHYIHVCKYHNENPL
jgi:hypothetical protein